MGRLGAPCGPVDDTVTSNEASALLTTPSERCPSGRRGRPAKALYGLNRIEGSNPSLSATETNDLIRGRFCCQTKRPPLRRLILQPERFVQHAHRELHILLVHYDRNLDL